MYRAKRMMEAGMQRTRIYKVGKAELFNVAKPLKIRMLNNVKHQVIGDGDKPINGVINDFLFVQNRCKKLARIVAVKVTWKMKLIIDNSIVN